MLALQVRQRPPKAARCGVAGVEIDQTPELRHGAAGIVQPPLVEIHQRHTHPHVVGRAQPAAAERLELHHGRLRLPQRAAEQGCAVHGRRDPFFPVGNGEALAREIPGARLLVLERAATAIPDAAAGEVAAAMLAL